MKLDIKAGSETTSNIKQVKPNLRVPSSCLWTLLSSFKMEVISCNMTQKQEEVPAVLPSHRDSYL